MVKSSSIVLLVGLLALWAELSSASGHNVTTLTMNNVHGLWSSGTLGPQPGPLPGTSVTLAFPVSEKEGVCPDTVVEAANCTEECQTDSDCEENLKCCQTGCGWSCQIPNVKPGSCPVVPGGIPLLGLCRNQCKVDSQCPGIMKCCMNGCRKQACVRPNV
ncbi:WAP four-disulfide core domain protein 2-like [Eretmochelys imbricata]